MKKDLSCFLLAFALVLCMIRVVKAQDLIPKTEVEMGVSQKVAFIVAPEDFRDEELFVPKEALEKAGFKTVIASTRLGKARGMLGGTVEAEVMISDIKAQDIQAIVVVGGGGSPKHLWKSESLHSLLQEMANSRKLIASICLSPGALAKAGVLKGKRATVWKDNLAISELKKGGALYEERPCIVDGSIITADGPKSAKAFADAIISHLSRK
ncbi:DJ-1/PfpI family protein [bacterium]|nr:DJ-1/PfpI family protein [bacterium]